MKVIKVDNEKCIKCMKCYDNCPEDVLAVNEEGYPYLKYEGECWFCGICWMRVLVLRHLLDELSETLY